MHSHTPIGEIDQRSVGQAKVPQQFSHRPSTSTTFLSWTDKIGKQARPQQYVSPSISKHTLALPSQLHFELLPTRIILSGCSNADL